MSLNFKSQIREGRVHRCPRRTTHLGSLSAGEAQRAEAVRVVCYDHGLTILFTAVIWILFIYDYCGRCPPISMVCREVFFEEGTRLCICICIYIYT